MEYLQYMLCMKCYEGLAGKGDVLMCNDCGLWQHRRCAAQNGSCAPLDFYLQFYLAVTLGEKPTHWNCDYCSKQQAKQKDDDDQVTKKVPSLRLPYKPTMEDISSDSSDDELTATFDITRSGREGPASTIPFSTDKTSSGVTLIPHQKIFLDNSPTPVTYSLHKEASGLKVVKDSRQNKFLSTGVIKGKVETYKCAHDGCRFQVRVCLSMMQFLQGYGAAKHSHDMDPLRLKMVRRQEAWTLQPNCVDTGAAAVESSDDSDSDTSSASLPSLHPALTPYNTPAKPNRSRTPAQQRTGWPSTSEDSSDSDDNMSPVLTTKTNKTYAVTNVAGCLSYCSGTTSGSDTETTETPVIQRFLPLTTPKVDHKINKSVANFSFSSSSSDSSDDDLNISALCDQLAEDGDEDSGRGSGDSDIPPPSPTDTLPACGSDVSDDDRDDDDGTVTADKPPVYTVTEGTMSGGRARLTDNHGYTYQIKFKLGMRIFWTCIEKSSRCSATVIQQRKAQFIKGAASHNHLPNQSETQNIIGSTHSTTTIQSEQGMSSNPPISEECVDHVTSVVETGEKLLPSQTSATVNKSKTAKIVRGVRAQKQQSDTGRNEKDVGESVKSPSTSMPDPTARLNDASGVIYEEVITCERLLYRVIKSIRPITVMVDSHGYVYTRKEDDIDCSLTRWRCGHSSCPSTVSVVRDQAPDNVDEDFVWVKRLENCTLDVPHNHTPEQTRTESVVYKMKAYILQQVYESCNGTSAKNCLQFAIQALQKNGDGQDPTLLVSTLQMKGLLAFVYRQQKIYNQNKYNDVLYKFARAGRRRQV